MSPRRFAAAGLLCLLQGCAGTDGEFPPGRYETRIEGSRSELDGAWRLEFSPEGQFRVTRDGQLAMSGSYLREGPRIRLTDEDGPLMCPPDRVTGIYEWTARGGRLALAAAEDECGGRRALFTRQPFARGNPP